MAKAITCFAATSAEALPPDLPSLLQTRPWAVLYDAAGTGHLPNAAQAVRDTAENEQRRIAKSPPNDLGQAKGTSERRAADDGGGLVPGLPPAGRPGRGRQARHDQGRLLRGTRHLLATSGQGTRVISCLPWAAPTAATPAAISNYQLMTSYLAETTSLPADPLRSSSSFLTSL